jgi:A/G-specific adenine glycosylase
MEDREALLAWGAAVRRDLPWRRTRDPWRILVAEVMAQQTQVDRVVPRWERFCTRWPDPMAMADAPLREVLDEWTGLGYPRRARALREAARRIRDQHGGEVPRHLTELLDLPGVGPYTARAVMAFAHELDEAVVDTNVGRVLARRAGQRLTPAAAQRAADAWMPAGQAWAWNQSLLDLGAAVCRPGVPSCATCPVSTGCAWCSAGRPEPDPSRGSAAVSKPQAAFAGSRRQARGRLLRALLDGPIRTADLAESVGWLGEGTDRAGLDRQVAEVAESLVADGLAVFDDAGRLAPTPD